MLRLSKKTLLALEAVVDIAINARPEPVQSKEITRRQGVPQRYLEQVMQHLVHAGILRGVRGPRGGYRLARERRRITVGDVVRVVNALEASEEPPLGEGSEIAARVIRPMIETFHDDLLRVLDGVTVDDLCERVRSAGIRTDGDARQDFTI
jgi:Rrf2 family protein